MLNDIKIEGEQILFEGDKVCEVLPTVSGKRFLTELKDMIDFIKSNPDCEELYNEGDSLILVDFDK